MEERTPRPKRKSQSRRSGSRGNRRTRGGAGRHNRSHVGLESPTAATRVCLSCDRPFRSRGPWNRICGRCHEEHILVQSTPTYRVSAEVDGRDADDG
jgi:hypothetical protein